MFRRRESPIDYKVTPEILSSQNKNIWELSNIDRKILKRDLKDNHGIARIFVHPFYFDYVDKFNRADYGSKNYQPNFNLERKDIVRKILESSLTRNKKRTPVFILEERDFIEETSKELEKDNDLAYRPIFIPSHFDTGRPLIPGHEMRRSSDERNWEDLNKVLSGLGAKKFIISGMYMELYRGHRDYLSDYYKQRESNAGGSLNLNYYFDRCVGHAVQGLSKKFKVDFSHANFPHNRKDVVKMENGKIDK